MLEEMFRNLPAIVILLGAIISAFGALWASYRQGHDRAVFEAELRKRSDELAASMAKQVNLQEQLHGKAEEQVGLQQQLRDKSDNIAQLNQELKNFVIGGDSFCYLSLGTLDNAANTGTIFVVHQGKYHLYDVHARIVDLEKFDEIKGRGITLETMKYTDTNVSIGNLLPGHAQMLSQINLGNVNRRRFNIFITARNGDFTQLLRFNKIDGQWLQATKVERGKGIPPFEQVDPKYPRNSKGQVDWD